ncbi:hypothetical protein VTJ83DRAFT_4989 [Remersonia thermophila]|uniref:DUF2415 domain-containing protein n=1 Tax=Remersonia thermophila TaxID=72144 RepID=A0ABR4DBI0_9PEZI
MAVSNNSYMATDDLILAKPRRRFRTGIRWQHWQLRSLIGVDGQNYVYFPVPLSDGGPCTVQRLNTKTRETEIVKRLSFNPRCLVARHGWVCCGGEGGRFSAFRVGGWNPNDSADRRYDLQADDPLPLSLDLPDALSAVLDDARSEKNSVARTMQFGRDRVNCITLWFPPPSRDLWEGAYDQAVAVLAHNDSSVIMVDLRRQEMLDRVTYPEYMNRGVISPNGRLLVAISDDPYLYVHERIEKKPEAGAPARYGDRPTYAWELCNKIQLKSQRLDDRSDNRGSFAACFSSTGEFLAVGTQYGTISIFHVPGLTHPRSDSLITFFNVSRANAEFGAVRDMAFSPGPNDLLAWTEDRGRVGVADVRRCFDARQILMLDQDEDFEPLSVSDRGTIDPRLLDQRSGGGGGGGSERSDAVFAFANALENRRSEGQSLLARYNVPLTADETAVLEAIQDYRRRQEQYSRRTDPEGDNEGGTSSSSSSNNNNNANHSSGSSAARPPPWSERAGRTITTTSTTTTTTTGGGGGGGSESTSAGTSQQRSASVSRTVNDVLDSIRDQRDRIRETHAAARLRARASASAGGGGAAGAGEDNSALADRRRYAAPPPPHATLYGIVGVPPHLAGGGATRGRGGGGGAGEGAGGSGSGARRGSIGSSGAGAGVGPGTLFSRLMANVTSAAAAGAGSGSSSSSGSSGTAAGAGGGGGGYGWENVEALASFLLREWEENPGRRIVTSFFVPHARPQPYDTAGLAWSEDGSILFVGAENGIFEFHVNTRARRMLPCIDPS